jgi:hypothetical protein
VTVPRLAVGPIGDGLLVSHKCLNVACCRPEHLAPLSRKQAAENRRGATKLSKTGVRGVYPHRGGRYTARVGRRYIGIYDTVEEAQEAVQLARRRLFTASFADRPVLPSRHGDSYRKPFSHSSA